MKARFFAVAYVLIFSVFLAGPAKSEVQGRCRALFESAPLSAAQRVQPLPHNLLTNSHSRPVQVIHFEGTRYLVLDLSRLPEAAPEYRLAVDYLYRDYPELMRMELNKTESFIREMNAATANDWSRIRLFLAVDDHGPVTSVTGGLAFIISHGPHESLPAVEKLKAVNPQLQLPDEFYPAAEIGRTGAFGTPSEKTRRFAQLLRLGHMVAMAENGIAEFLVFTKTSLLVFYEREVPVERLANLPPDNPATPRLHDIVGRFLRVRQ